MKDQEIATDFKSESSTKYPSLESRVGSKHMKT